MIAATQPHTVLVIGGPTASGKSGLALGVAKAANGAVINADSLQVYDSLPLLTAQPSPTEKQQRPHHLYGALQPHETCTAARWRDMALAVIDTCIAASQLPVIVGGTGFYINTLMNGISPIPDIPPAVREQAIALQKEMGNPAFYQMLLQQDPAIAGRIDPMNTQRVVRAFEVFAHTGTSIAAWQDVPPTGVPTHLRFITVALLPPREALYANANLRFEKMLDGGAIDEATTFAARIKSGDIPADTPLTHALGYTEIVQMCAGTITRAEAVERAQQTTRNYAKRQYTWFRNQWHADLILETPDATAVCQHLKVC